MKLAEALINRKELESKREDLANRIFNNVNGQEGETPNEDPNELIRELKETNKEFIEIVQRINRTNNRVEIKEGFTISDALVKREGLLKLVEKLRTISEQGTISVNRYSLSEIKYVTYVDIKEMQREIDQYSKEARELDVLIQQSNWTVDLI